MTHSDPIQIDAPGRDDRGTVAVRRITWIGLFGNVLVSALKFFVGLVGSSQAVVADAVHSLSDTTTDIAILVGVRFWSPPADECHPYGHSRIEAIVTLGIGFVLAFVALGIGYHGIITVRDEHIERPRMIAFTGVVISIVIKEILYRWTVSVGRRKKSSALIANAWHHRSDALSSVPAALSVAVASFSRELSFVDHVGAIIVSLFILHASWKIMRPAFEELSDSGVPSRIKALIHAAGSETAGIEDVHAIRTRRMGSGILVDLHITVDGDMSVSSGHEVSEEVKRRIEERVPNVLDVVVHLEPGDLEGDGDGRA